MGDSGYKPIDCDFHDQLEACATMGQRVRLTLIPESGKPGREETAEGVIADIFTTPSKEEFLRLEDGTAIRLDRIKGLRIETAHA